LSGALSWGALSWEPPKSPEVALEVAEGLESSSLGEPSSLSLEEPSSLSLWGELL
jgi:hypothetical protein